MILFGERDMSGCEILDRAVEATLSVVREKL